MNTFEDSSHLYPFDDSHQRLQQSQQNEALTRKLQVLALEENPKVRRRLTHEITLDISQMILENKEMKKELIAFVTRLKGS